VKGFPNQIADLEKLADGMRALVERLDAGENPRDDGVYGPALVRAGVAGTGHTPVPVEEYIARQLQNAPSDQSFRTTARGLRELYRVLGFIDDSGDDIVVTDLGHQAAAFAGAPLDPAQLNFWRNTIRDMAHDGGDGETSHPYQVLLRLVGQRPGITRAKCALALEARNDSAAELARIVALADLPDDEIRTRIRVSRRNTPVTPQTWENAVKVLPSFAEQLRDVVVTTQNRVRTYRLADAPGRADAGPAAPQPAPAGGAAAAPRPRAPRTSRAVTPDTIGRGRTIENFDEEEDAAPVDAAAAAAGRERLRDRYRRHESIVHDLAVRLAAYGTELHADPFDILALSAALGILVEVKTLDGTESDERVRVREAFGQLLYYEPFAAAPMAGDASIQKIACFERPISQAHRDWLNGSAIGVIWSVGNGRFDGDALARDVLAGYLEELR
jgi:hypothetical protein